MNVRIGVSFSSDVQTAVTEAAFLIKKPVLILFFAPVAQFAHISQALSLRFPTATVVGTTTHYLYSSKGLSISSLGLVSFEDGVECAAGVIEEIKRYPMKYVSSVKNAHDAIPHDDTVCLEFTTALSMSEELVLATLNSVCEEYDTPIFGASAGLSDDDFVQGKPSYVSCNGKVYSDASVYCFIHNQHGRIIPFKENIYKPTSAVFKATSVDVRNRIIHELDGMPIVKVLCDALHCTPQNLKAYLQIYPLGRVVEDTLYMSDFNTIFDDGSISWNARIYNGTNVCLTKPDDYRSITQMTMKKIHEQIEKPSFTLMCHCLARTMFYKQEGYLDEYARICGRELAPLLGLSSTGEQMLTTHLNQTMTALVFE